MAITNNNQYEDPSNSSLFEENPTHRRSSNHEEDIAVIEDKAVYCLRLVVLFVLVVATLGVSLSVYFYLDRDEQAAFEEQFNSDASKLLESIGTTLDNTLGPVDSLIVNLVAYAGATRSTFPFVTLPSYGIQAAKVLRISKGFHLQWSFVVHPEEAEAWKEYANKTHPRWVDYGLDIMEGDPEWQGLVYKNYTQRSCYDMYAWGGIPVEEPVKELGFYSPNWMEYPIMSGANNGWGCPYNYDHLQLVDVANAVQFMMTQQRAVFGNFPTVNFDTNIPEQAFRKAALDNYVRGFVPPDVDPSEPFTQMAFPIFDTIESLYTNTSQPQDYKGHVALNIQFRDLIRNTLPDQSTGIILVVDQGACGIPFTYRIDAAMVTYMGRGDQHDPKYDDMARTQVLEGMVDTTNDLDRRSRYTGIPVSSDFCPNTLHIYPSRDMEDNHRTKNPTLLSIIAASIFIFTSIVFLLYDILVARRQKIVMNRALDSGAIVSSLFPEEVREKLYEENRQRFQKEAQMKNFTYQEQGNAEDAAGAESHIAALYPKTTIFFADLVGFTSWSSKRQPSEVFKLLETIYGAFDVLADKRGVYKIETIGDCYVSITGCPKPQADHAVIMVKFAADCLRKMSQLTGELAGTLGEDTKELDFRVGLHSGPVTAGVLRGKKARFQLFGDSVNMASRMESNGVRGCIHVSQATADELSKLGKNSWLTKREEKITAKGKGEIQTYFVSPRMNKNSAVSEEV